MAVLNYATEYQQVLDPTPEVILKPTNTQQLNNNPMNFNFTPIHNKPTN